MEKIGSLNGDFLMLKKGTKLKVIGETKSGLVLNCKVLDHKDEPVISVPHELVDLEVGPTSTTKKTKTSQKVITKKQRKAKKTVLLTELTGGTLPFSGINYEIGVYDESIWQDEDRANIPDEDKDYVWDANMLEAIHLAYILNEKSLLVGMPGTGKTSSVKQYAATIKHPYMRINGKDGVDQSSFLGTMTVIDGDTVWQDGAIPYGVSRGYIICIDEVFKLTAATQMALQNLYEKDGFVVLDDKPGSYADKKVDPHPYFRLYLTDNSKGFAEDLTKFAATTIQDTSTLDRIAIVKEAYYLDEEQEKTLIQKKVKGTSNKTAMRLVRWANLIRRGYRYDELSVPCSPRTLLVIANLIKMSKMPTRMAVELAYTNKLPSKAEVETADKLFNTVFG